LLFKVKIFAMEIKRHILVVDDEISTLALVCQLLEKLGYHTTSASSGDEALRCLKENDRIDFVLTDINMPKMDGWELTIRIKAIYPKLPIIAMTGESPATVIPRLHNDGISGALFKPFKTHQLIKAISNVLEFA